jgi:hypothetical protein
MPLITEHQLEGYQFGVAHLEVPAFDENGNQVFNGTGGPKMTQQIRLQFVGMTPTLRHVVTIPLTPEARDEMVCLLTGGIAVASRIPDGPIL